MDITEDVPQTPTQRFREAIASRSEDYAAAFPHSVVVEAEALHGMSTAINGAAVELSGTRSVEGFRGALRGEKNFHFADLCRLATNPTKEARAAVRAALTVLAASIGYELVAIDAPALEAHEALGHMAQAMGTLQGHTSLSLANDGVIDQHEARALEPHLDAAQKSLDRMKATVSRAKGSR